MIRLFKHYIPRGLLILALVELCIFFISVYFGKVLTSISYEYELRHETLSAAIAAYQETPLQLSNYFLKGMTFTLIMSGTLIAMGLYERNFWDGKGDMILRVGIGFVLGFLLLTLVYYVIPEWRLFRREFSLAFSLAFVGVMLARYIFLKAANQDTLKRRILVLGAGHKASEIERLLSAETTGFTVAGYVPIVGDAEVIPPNMILTVESSLFALSQQQRIDEIVIAIDDRRSGVLPMEDILECKIDGVEVSDLLAFIERETGKIKLDDLRPSDMVFSDGFRLAVLKRTTKRCFDILISLIILILTAPLMLLTALAVWLESGCREPIFYLQERVGRHEQVFKVIKFRSMRVDAEKDGQARWAQKNDPRVTRIGNFMRKVRLDELPQLFNVLLGQMSFVGPRPERPQLVAQLEKEIPYYSLRHKVKPGITGWAQLCYPYGNTIEDAWRKLEYDLYYIKNYSLFLDLIVLLQTTHVVLWAKGH